MKKALALVLALLVVFSVAACGPKEPTPTKTPDGPSTTTWPNGEVTILAGYETGSLTDINIRTIADWIKESTGTEVKIENNATGGGANLANRLVAAKPDGQTMMLIGMNCISNYYSGIWSVNPCDDTKFKIVCGAIQPYPHSGCVILTQPDAPYDTWDELAAYAKANPGTVTVASIAGKVMDSKMKAVFNVSGVAKDIRWAPTTSADATAGLLGGNINIVMLDETTAAPYIKNGDVKAIVNTRVSDNFHDIYADDYEYFDILEKIPTLSDVFGADAEKYMVPNSSVFVVPADTPDEICAQIAKVIDAIDEVDETSEFYERCRVNGGTSKYWTWPGEEVSAEWKRLDPIIKQIVEMN